MSDISNDKLYEVLLVINGKLGEVTGGLGEVKASVANGHEFTKAVSSKADVIRVELAAHAAKDEAHLTDLSAHGLGGEQKAKNNIFPWLITGMAIFAPIVWELIRGRLK